MKTIWNLKKDQEQTEDQADLIPQEQERPLKKPYKRFTIPEFSKADVAGYGDQVKLHVETLIKS